ncbi:hypothetical protein L226DRAFT_208058 [Lentinus tigrinus ALCF2SS1-7]|uniref:uncharacterized protein n=1 Tax=Lentinus tigrinus ALCF2SS1-7 TaxID=1328758 RepID=UPI0011661B76|nr:hypothetical protein L226DRAFT_208058 [Lentinus tigrinus ALCF2SS1-7]
MASSTVRAFNDHDQLATPPPDDDDLVASTIVQASLQSERTIGDAPQATQGTDPPPALDTHPESSTGSPSEDSTPPFARQFVVPQSLYRPVPSIDWMDSFGFTIGRITFNLRKRVRDKQGVPMSLLLNDRDEVVAKALQGANDEVLSDLVRRGMRRMILRIAVSGVCHASSSPGEGLTGNWHTVAGVSRLLLRARYGNREGRVLFPDDRNDLTCNTCAGHR